FALNLFTAICAAVALTLLARSVALLLGAVGSPSLAEVGKLADCGTVGPPRSTSAGEVGRDRQALPGLPIAPLRISWVAPVLAVTLCGLQLSFWEHATAFTGEMIDLLIFAYVIRCLLEFRNDERESWLFRSAFIYSAG